jgi:uncharacterized protein (TIGR02453 family)
MSTFSRETFAWFIGIIENNTTDHKEQYLRVVKEPFEVLLNDLAKEFGGTPYIFRPNRDVRFSKDKTLYKTHISGYLGGRTDTQSDMYIHLSHNSLFAATGYHEMAADQLEKYRHALTGIHATTYGSQLRGILENLTKDGFLIGGESLKTAPRGIDKNAENIDLIRRKAITISRELSFEEAMNPEKAREFVRLTWKAGKPLAKWLDVHVGPSLLPARER